MPMMLKWPLRVRNDTAIVECPTNTVFKHVAMQRGELCVWGLGTPGSLEERTLLVIGTGMGFPAPPADREWRYVGTALTADQRLVWHVFDTVWNRETAERMAVLHGLISGL